MIARRQRFLAWLLKDVLSPSTPLLSTTHNTDHFTLNPHVALLTCIHPPSPHPPTHTVRANSDCPLSSHHKTMDYVNEFSAFFYRVGWSSWLGIIGCAGQCTHSWETHVDRLWPSGLLNWVWRGRNNRSVVDCLISMHMVLSSIFSILIKKKKTSLIKHRLHGSCCDPSTWVSQGSGTWEQTWPIWTSVLRGKQ